MYSILNEHYALFFSLIILCFGIIYKFSSFLQFPLINKSILVLSIFLLLNIVIISINDLNLNTILYNYIFIKTQSTLFIEISTTILFICIILTSIFFNKKNNIPIFEYIILLIFILISIHLLIAAEELFSFYLILEFQSICLYILSSLQKNKYSVEGAIKYFILGSFSSILILIGFSFIYGISGLTTFEDISIYLINNKINQQNELFIYLSIIFISIGFFFKIYMAPMHLWVSDIYEQSPITSVMIFTSTSILPFYFIFFKFYVDLFQNYEFIWKTILIISCLFSILIGTIGALYQYSIKRLLAYSSIANTGYIFLSFLFYESPLLITNAIVYLLIYNINTFGFLSLLSNIRLQNEKKEEYNIQNIYDFIGLYHTNRYLSFFFKIYLYAIAGLPPFSFFFSKIYLFSSILYNKNYIILTLFLAVCTIISVFYYIRIIQFIYFNKKVEYSTYKSIPFIVLFINYLIIFMNFIFIFNNDKILTIIYTIVLSMYI